MGSVRYGCTAAELVQLVGMSHLSVAPLGQVRRFGRFSNLLWPVPNANVGILRTETRRDPDFQTGSLLGVAGKKKR